jgi:DNA-binding transcriptional LysR family regulator
VLVASPTYLARQGVPQSPADLAAHRCLTYANFGKSAWTLSRGVERVKVDVSSHLSANEATALLRAALAGGGLALQPTYLANPHLADGSLQQVLPDWTLPDMAIYALYTSRRHLSPAVRALLDFLADRFAGSPW